MSDFWKLFLNAGGRFRSRGLPLNLFSRKDGRRIWCCPSFWFELSFVFLCIVGGGSPCWKCSLFTVMRWSSFWFVIYSRSSMPNIMNNIDSGWILYGLSECLHWYVDTNRAIGWMQPQMTVAISINDSYVALFRPSTRWYLVWCNKFLIKVNIF